ncbi:hypothetical protein JAAARDRAFT_400570, partial [Jaapia argillacea MUCL 33604]
MVQHVSDTISTATSAVNAVTSAAKPFADVWQPVLTSVEAFVKSVDAILELHPYAKAAWSLLSCVYKMAVDQIERDAKINSLAGVMYDIYEIAKDADPLKDYTTIGDTLKRMLLQTVECAYFIRAYAETKGFVERTIKNKVFPVDEVIVKFEKTFEGLKSDLLNKATIQASITVFRIWDTVKELGKRGGCHSDLELIQNLYIEGEIVLGDLPYASASFKIELECLPGTREEVLKEIVDWANNASRESDGSRVFLITGVAGSGKSAIAHTVARRFAEQDRLGSSFFFKRGSAERTLPEYLFGTIARDLADQNRQFRSNLLDVVRDNRSLRQTTSVPIQFRSFVLEPTRDLTIIGPIIIVIDALDECSDYAYILDILAFQLAKLPDNFCILITARSGDAINRKFKSSSYTRHKRMEEIPHPSTTADISLFIDSQLRNGADVIEEIVSEWPDGRWCPELTAKADGLFIWALTACRFIQQAGHHPVDRLKMLISEPGQYLRDIDQLYLRVLEHSLPDLDNKLLQRFQSVIGSIILARAPLSICALGALLHLKDGSIGRLLHPLGSLLSGVLSDTEPIHFLHTSFR